MFYPSDTEFLEDLWTFSDPALLHQCDGHEFE